MQLQTAFQFLITGFSELETKNTAKSLTASLKEVIKKLSVYPQLGRQLENREESFFVKDSYQIFYLETSDSIEIVHIWDSRRNPGDLSL